MKYQSKDLGKFPEQIKFSLEKYTSPGISLSDFNNIILCGLGGSGIAGRIIKSYFDDKCPVPIVVVSDYSLPSFADSKTLCFICSYSGNTEETLGMYENAKRVGAKIIGISTGGKLGELCTKDQFPLYLAESGFQPRMALGYSLTYLLLLFSELCLDNDARATLSPAADQLSNDRLYKDEAVKIFHSIEADLPSKIIVICDRYSSPVGLRFCQQLQENAKYEAFIHELPEANHNVIETYYGKLDSIFIFLNSEIHPRTSLRFKYLNQVLGANENEMYCMKLEHNSLPHLLETIYTLDWLSLLIADHKEVNSSEIKNILGLKDYLSEH